MIGWVGVLLWLRCFCCLVLDDWFSCMLWFCFGWCFWVDCDFGGCLVCGCFAGLMLCFLGLCGSCGVGII